MLNTKINPELLSMWESMKLSSHRRFFKEDPSLIEEMQKAYIRLFGKVNSVDWFEYGAMQCPTDYLMYTETIRFAKPQVIIETGTASGSSALFYGEILERINGNKDYLVITIERFPAPDMPNAIKKNPNIISVIGDSTDPAIVDKVKSMLPPGWRVLVTFDSDHSAEHVMAELSAYADLVSVDSYCIVQDTYLGLYWGGNLTLPQIHAVINKEPNCVPFDYHPCPLGAVEAFLNIHPEFEVDYQKQRWLITQHPFGWLKRVK